MRPAGAAGQRYAVPAGSLCPSSLIGTVLDRAGASLPGATVSVKNDATGAWQKMTSDELGKYSFSNLPAGAQ
jgi:hypothetical protein